MTAPSSKAGPPLSQVELVPVRAAHAEELYTLLVGSNVTDTIAWDGPTSLEDFRSGLAERERATAAGQMHQYTIVDGARLIGSCDVRSEPISDCVEVGLWIGGPFQGRGAGTKVISLLVDQAFSRLGARTVRASIFVNNVASRRAFEKCGFVLRDTRPRDSLKRGAQLDEWVLELDLRGHLLRDLSGSEFQSLLLGVYAERAQAVTPSALLQSWERDRFVTPAPISPLDFNRFDRLAFETAASFEPIELSPVCPLGTNGAVAPVSQNKVVSTVRSTEVVSDSTNVMALECAIRRRRLLKANPKSAEPVRLCSSHRLVRAQQFSGPGMVSHFRVFALVTAGRDTGSERFESSAMAEQIVTLCSILARAIGPRFRYRDLDLGIYGEKERLVSRVEAALKDAGPEIPVRRLGSRSSGYYPTVSFLLQLKREDGTLSALADGGITDWTQKLIGSKKERLMISGLGIDRTISQFLAVAT